MCSQNGPQANWHCQPVEDIIVNHTEPYPDQDATDDVDIFNKNIPSRNLTEADNHHLQHN